MHHKVQCYDIHWEYTILWLKQTTLGINTYMIICKFCDKECKSLNSKAQHELYCKLNPDAKIKKASMGMLGKSGSNQFIKGTAKPMSEEGRSSQAGNMAWPRTNIRRPCTMILWPHLSLSATG